MKRIVSRILSSLLLTEATMYLEIMLPLSSSGVPKQHINYFIDKKTSSLLFLRITVPISPCTTRGLPCHYSHLQCGKLLPHHFTLTVYNIHTAVCFLLHFPSACIATNHHRLYVIKRVALWCSDFPH